MKKPFSSACCWVTVVLAATILSGCVHSYPPPTFKLDVTYPLQPCTPEKVNAAASQVTLQEGGLKHDNDTVCRTALAGAPAPAPTPVADGTKVPDAACSEPAIYETTRANESQNDRARRLEQQAFTRQERCLRERLEAPFAIAARAGKRFGIALSGGGSKASAFGIGVLAGLSDLGLLDRADYVSSVSGGSYAAYFYYAHRIFPLVRNDRRRTLPSNEELFRDCVAIAGRGHEEVGRSDLEQHAEIKLINNIRRSVPYCNLYELPTYRWDPAQKRRIDVPPGRYQTLLKCMQDLLRPGDCTMLPTSVRRSGISPAMVVGSLVTVPLAFVSNSLFDWGLATSPSGISYEDGIGLAYGATLTDTSEFSELTVTRRLRNCGPQDSGEYLLLDCRQDVLDPDPEPMTFDELRVGMLKARKHGDDGLPFWILNAVAPEYRSLFGWMRRGAKHTSDSDMFEMTAVSHGSGRFGYVSASPAIHDMDVLDAVRASAAFFDANQLVYTNRFKRTGIGLFLHLANLDWGLDIPNYNVSTTRRTVHRFLPFPLYYLDGLATRVGLSGKENTFC